MCHFTGPEPVFSGKSPLPAGPFPSYARHSNRGTYPMNNTDLAEALAADHGLTKADARKYVDAVFSSVAGAAAKGDEVSLNGFGKFKVKDSPAREGRNPSTGATIQIAASKKLTFTPAKAVKDQLNG
ncbi:MULTISPECIES: HU family DNA-binding protein [Sphingobium]|nr:MULTISPECIES: HU family DNA-binding protein [Sphingobium]